MARIKGFELRGLKGFRGHEGEPLQQGNIYYDGKKVGFFSEDSHGGSPTVLYDGDRAQRDAMEERAAIASKAYFEKYPEDRWGKEDGYNEEEFYSALLAFTVYEKQFKKIKKDGFNYLTIIREKNIISETMIAHKVKHIKKDINDYDIECTKFFESEADFIIE